MPPMLSLEPAGRHWRAEQPDQRVDDHARGAYAGPRERELTWIDIAGSLAYADAVPSVVGKIRCVVWLWGFWRSCRCRQPGRLEPRNMIRTFRFACTSTSGLQARTRIAATIRLP